MDLMDYRRKIIMSSPHLSHAEGAVASFSDGTDLPLKSLLVDIDPVQSGSGDPSPSNVRPISGWSAANVTGTGKNLWDKVNGGILDGYLGSTDIINSSTRKVAYIRCAPNTTYTVSKTRSIANDRFYVAYTKNITVPIVGTAIFGTVNVPNSGTVGTQTSCSITTGADAKWLVCWFSWDTSVQTDDINSLQFELGSSASSYSPYTGTSLTISLGQTVYGGTLNVLTGELTVDRAMATFDGSDDESWYAYSSYNGFNYRTLNMQVGTRQSGSANWLKVTQDSTQSNAVWLGTNNSWMYIVRVADLLTEYTVDAWRAYLAQNPLTVVYPLATPLEIQLTPNQVNSLVGQNNIFSDTGNIALDYWAHP